MHHGTDNHSVRRDKVVLGVLDPKGGDRAQPILAVNDGRDRVRPHPPQSIPVVVVVVDQERYPRIRGDVVQPAQRR